LYWDWLDTVWRGVLLLPRGLQPGEAKVYCLLSWFLPWVAGPHTLERLCNVP